MNNFNKRFLKEYLEKNGLTECHVWISLMRYNINGELIILPPFMILAKLESYKVNFFKKSKKLNKYILVEPSIINNCGKFFFDEKDCIADFNSKLFYEVEKLNNQEIDLKNRKKMLEDNFINTDFLLEKLYREK